MLTKFSVRVNLGLICAGAFFCLTPLLTLKIEKSYSTDDVAYTRIRGAIPEPSIPILASFFMVLIPAADLMIDLSSQIASFFLFKKTAVIDRSLNGAVVTRLSDIERLIFILGVTMQSGLWFLPSNTDDIILGLNEICIMNCSIILLIGPIIMYLERCTTTFTESLSVAMLFILVVGLFCTTLSFFFRDERSTYSGLVSAGGICTAITGALFLLTVFLCAYRSYFKILVMKLLKYNRLVGLYQSSKMEESGIQSDDEDQAIFRNDMMYTHFIPFLHIVCILIIAAANFVAKYSNDHQRQESLRIKHFITLAAEIVVLVLEYRIRKNEIARGLVRVLNELHIIFFFICI